MAHRAHAVVLLKGWEEAKDDGWLGFLTKKNDPLAWFRTTVSFCSLKKQQKSNKQVKKHKMKEQKHTHHTSQSLWTSSLEQKPGESVPLFQRHGRQGRFEAQHRELRLGIFEKRKLVLCVENCFEHTLGWKMKGNEFCVRRKMKLHLFGLFGKLFSNIFWK